MRKPKADITSVRQPRRSGADNHGKSAQFITEAGTGLGQKGRQALTEGPKKIHKRGGPRESSPNGPEARTPLRIPKRDKGRFPGKRGKGALKKTCSEKKEKNWVPKIGRSRRSSRKKGGTFFARE